MAGPYLVYGNSVDEINRVLKNIQDTHKTSATIIQAAVKQAVAENTTQITLNSGSSSGIPSTRRINTGTGLLGGGNLSSDLTISIASTVLVNPMNAQGDVIVGGVSGAPTRVGIGTTGQIFTSTGTTAGWADPAGSGIYTVTTLPPGILNMRAFVTDALAPTFGATVVTGGAVGVPVYFDGTSWKVG